jgi:hypothetical protein
MMCLGQNFIRSKCRIVPKHSASKRGTAHNNSHQFQVADCFAGGTLDAGYRDLEQQYNDLDWLLVDSGSTIHVCRDKHKLHNMRRHTTRIRGIVGDAVAVSEWVGDWDLTLQKIAVDSSGSSPFVM